MDLTRMSPAEIDAAWLEAVSPANRKFAAANDLMLKATKNRKWGGHYAESAAGYEERATKLYAEAREMRDAVEPPFSAEWNRRGGWTRAYVVPGGHIHKTTSCHTLYPTTLISWLPEQSGLSEDEIVTLAGVHACTVCYPTAPVERLLAEAAAEKAKSECPGSRTWDHDSSGLRYMSPRARCNHCGQTVSATSTGKLRAHKPKVAA